MMKKYLKYLLVTFIFSTASYAVEPPKNTQVITAASLLDVVTGEIKNYPVIKIEKGVITNVQFNKNYTPKANEKHIDLPETTLLPGLMDMHVHLTYSPYRFGYSGLGVSVPRSTIYGVKHAKDTLNAGFTTVRNVGASGYADVALRDAINDGDILGPRLLVSGPALGITGGHCDNNLLPSSFKAKSSAIADGPWQAVAKVREVTKYGADMIKLCATGGVFSKGTKVGVQQYSLEEMSAIVQEAHRKGIIVAAHAHGKEGIKAAINAGIDSIEHASFLDQETIQLAKEKGTFLTMDVYVTDYILTESLKNGALSESIEKEKLTGKRQRKSFRQAVEAGVKVVFGTDAAIFPHGQNAKQFSVMVEHGMSELQAIQSATTLSAELIGYETKLGQIQKGFFADIVGVSANPLEQINTLEKIQFVMKSGEMIKNNIKNKDLK
jgi:imidazolonepropionase-like amidohydrolase